MGVGQDGFGKIGSVMFAGGNGLSFIQDIVCDKIISNKMTQDTILKFEWMLVEVHLIGKCVVDESVDKAGITNGGRVCILLRKELV